MGGAEKPSSECWIIEVNIGCRADGASGARIQLGNEVTVTDACCGGSVVSVYEQERYVIVVLWCSSGVREAGNPFGDDDALEQVQTTPFLEDANRVQHLGHRLRVRRQDCPAEPLDQIRHRAWRPGVGRRKRRRIATHTRGAGE